MTTLTLPLAMPLHGDVDRREAIWVGLIEADDIATTPDRIALASGDAFDRARLLVRDHGTVRGYVTLPVVAGALDAEALIDAVAALPPVPAAARPAPTPVSVVVCTRDRADLLREALDAIRAIDYPSFEVVVVDNAPATTDTHDLLRTEYPEFRYVREDAAGLSHARNAGLHAATASIVAFTDDDVIVDPQWLWAIASGFSRADDVGCVSGVVPTGELRNEVQAYFDARVSWSKLTASRVFRLSDPPADLPMFPFCVGEFGTGANFAIRRDHMVALGGFDTALGAGTRTKGGEDLDMFMRVLYDGQAIVVEPSALVWHRHRADLEALTAQAVGYGRGFGAWATTVALDPRMLGAAVARSPRAIARLLNKPMSTVDDSPASSTLSKESKRVGRVELGSIFGGPASYFAERRAQREAGTLAGPPSRGPAMERRCWATLAAVGGVFGLLAMLPLPAGLSLAFVALFILIGPGALVRAWVVLPPNFAPIVIPAIGISVMLLLTTAIVYAQLWNPLLWLLILAVVTCLGAVATFTIRRTA
ncbi:MULTISPECIES: glycosyltransferase [unclassified Microbacterium]|uniref:glycosyltransferase family 2 protein n=1 Tax=unclassified Microbacterium TaxID=2609290 RepID=UPI00214C2C7B|nr:MULTISPECIES: glycosyltransferase [unclassified Microbacterium]MCR2785374.1 glycosyltransferase [Microbacterium sp. zg.B96]WIM16899.1 glycosyltransferase [Microbacterium sp. zg-B96]